MVDCDNQENNDICGAFDITGYPRLLYLKGDKYYRYKGERTIEKLTEFIYEGGFQEAEAKDIPFYIEKTHKFKSSGIVGKIVKLAEAIAERLSYIRIPTELKYVLLGVAISIPFHFIRQYFLKTLEKSK